MVLLHQLSYAIKSQLKAPKAPYKGLWDEMPPTRGISCLSLVLYGIRIGGFHPKESFSLCHKEPAKGKKCP